MLQRRRILKILSSFIRIIIKNAVSDILRNWIIGLGIEKRAYE